MSHSFEIVDVFTATARAGNQLAVVTDARGLDTAAMQSIAREFNFAETSFVRVGAEDSREDGVFTGARVIISGYQRIVNFKRDDGSSGTKVILTADEVAFSTRFGPLAITRYPTAAKTNSTPDAPEAPEPTSHDGQEPF